jgi:hypothetical protein
MAIDIITGFNSSSRESLDKRSGPYATLVDAKAALNTNERYVGLKVLVADGATFDTGGNIITGDLTEYVFSGGIADGDLLEAITLKSDVDTLIGTAVSSLIDGAPGTLDTLNELAAALEDNANIFDNYYTQAQLDDATTGKADKSTTYTETEVDTFLDAKANQSTTYTKTETDDLLDDKADKSNTYTETEVDTFLNAKANQSTTYTETEVDTFLNAKANQSTTYTKTETDTLLDAKANQSTTYTKTETDTLLDDKPSSANYDNIVQLTQIAYNALGTPDSTTLYIIVG